MEEEESKETRLENDEETTESSNDAPVEEILSEDVKKERRDQALTHKQEGNALFKEKDFEGALLAYSKGVDLCPREFAEELSVLYSNRAACSFYMNEYDDCVEDASLALDLKENYQKARLRRAAAYEKLEKLENALEDYKFVVERDRSCQVAGEAVMRLPDKIKEKNEKLKAEMIDKLKDLGNMVLKPFGLSTNNFKFEQDPSSGGYSVNFQK